MQDETVVLSWRPDFDAVQAHAIATHGPDVVPAIDARCPRARALARLWIRRFAMGKPPAGQTWTCWALLPLVRAEMDLMCEDPADLCHDPECLACRELVADVEPDRHGWPEELAPIVEGAGRDD